MSWRSFTPPRCCRSSNHDPNPLSDGGLRLKSATSRRLPVRMSAVSSATLASTDNNIGTTAKILGSCEGGALPVHDPLRTKWLGKAAHPRPGAMYAARSHKQRAHARAHLHPPGRLGRQQPADAWRSWKPKAPTPECKDSPPPAVARAAIVATRVAADSHISRRSATAQAIPLVRRNATTPLPIAKLVRRNATTQADRQVLARLVCLRGEGLPPAALEQKHAALPARWAPWGVRGQAVHRRARGGRASCAGVVGVVLREALPCQPDP